MSRFVILFEKNSPQLGVHGIVWLILFLGQLTTFILFQASFVAFGVNSSYVGIFTGLRCEQAQQVQRKIYAKSEKRQALRLPICNDFSRLVCRYETLRHKAVALQLPCWCYQNFLPWAHKSAIYGEGSGPKHQLEGPKSAILEKELANFELRKVLFSEKHLRELPGAYIDRSSSPSVW